MLTSLGEKLSDEEVDELLKGAQINPCVGCERRGMGRGTALTTFPSSCSNGNIDYESFVRQILAH